MFNLFNIQKKVVKVAFILVTLKEEVIICFKK